MRRAGRRTQAQSPFRVSAGVEAIGVVGVVGKDETVRGNMVGMVGREEKETEEMEEKT
jgi:hypothetical protein